MNLFIVVALKCTVALNQPLVCHPIVYPTIDTSKEACKSQLAKVKYRGIKNAKCVAIKPN